jgi:hypothetical protein
MTKVESALAAPTPERAQCKLCNSTGHETPCAYPTEINRQQAETVQKLKEALIAARKVAAGASNERADAEKDAVLMQFEDAIKSVVPTRDRARVMHYARTILAANKEKP